MKKIPLQNGLFTLVDDKDFDYLNQWHWWFHGRYVVRDERYGKRKENKKHRFLLHRVVVGARESEEVDHVDSDGLNNTRGNLRLCRHSENACNRSKQRNNTSGYKGVYFNKMANKWQAYFSVDNKPHYLGLFVDKDEAARAYNDAVKKQYGSFAKLNVIQSPHGSTILR